ncbi:MAG: cellulose synthase subunit BcsC-related outer membrane protein [Sphingomonadales bacterium]
MPKRFGRSRSVLPAILAAIAFSAMGVAAGRAQAPGAISPDVRPVYEAIKAGELERARSILVRLRNNFPGWSPDRDLLRMLDERQIEIDLEAALAARDWDRIIAVAKRHRSRFVCPRVDFLWPLADAHLARGDSDAAIDVFERIVRTCARFTDRLATLYKAIGMERGADVARLFAIEGGVKHKARDRIAFYLARMRAARQFDDMSLMEAAEALAHGLSATPTIDVALELAAAFSSLERFDDALHWYRTAIDEGGGDAAIKGATVAAINLGRIDDAADYLSQLQVRDPETTELFQAGLAGHLANADVNDAVVKMAVSVTASARDPVLAGLLAARFAMAGEARRADRWFERAVIFSESRTAPPGYADNLLTAGYRALTDQQPSLARRVFDLAVRLKVERATVGKARAEVVLGALDAAFETAKVMDPGAGEPETNIFLQLGWAAVDQDRFDLALAVADILSAANAGAPDRDLLAQTALVRKATAAFDADRVKDSLVFARQAADLGDSGARVLEGWSLVQLDRTREAAYAFEQAYREGAGDPALDGLASILAELPAAEREAYTARIPTLAELIRAGGAQAAFDRDQFLLAHGVRPGKYAVLENIETPWVQAGFDFRFTDGAGSRGRFLGFATHLAGRVAQGRNIFTMSAQFAPIDTGEPTAVFPGGPALEPDQETVVVPQLDWRREQEQYTLLGSLGSSPLGGAVGASPTFRLGGTYYLADGGQLAAQISASSRLDSLLALSGAHEADGSENFGRVLEYGISGGVSRPLGDFSVTAQVRGSLLRGRNVANNSRVGGSASLMRNFQIRGFDYFTVGPSVTLDHYARDLDFFSFGNGGYFSPQFFLLSGGVLAFQTVEARQWVARGTILAGWELIKRDPGLEFPLLPISAELEAGDANGPSGSIQLESIHRLAGQWILQAGVGINASSDFTEARAGIALRYSFGERRALVSGDFFTPLQGFSQR